MEVDPSSTSPVPPTSQPPNNSKQSGNNSSGESGRNSGQVRANREDEDKKKKIAVAAVADPAKNAQSLKGYFFFCFRAPYF